MSSPAGDHEQRMIEDGQSEDPIQTCGRRRTSSCTACGACAASRAHRIALEFRTSCRSAPACRISPKGWQLLARNRIRAHLRHIVTAAGSADDTAAGLADDMTLLEARTSCVICLREEKEAKLGRCESARRTALAWLCT